MEIGWDRLDQGEWTAALVQAGSSPLQQSWDYGVAMAALGAGVRRAVITDQGRMIAAAQVLERRGLRLIGRGPVWTAPVDQAMRRAVLRRLARRAGPVVAVPGDGVRGFGLIPLMTPAHHALWDLTPAVADLRAGLSGKWRNRLVRAEGLAISRGDGRTLAALIREEAVQRAARGYRALPGAFAQAWPGERHLWQWRQGGRMRAAMLFLRHGDWATYQTGWTDEAGRGAFAHGPMLWQAALALKAAGVRMLDLGSVSADAPGLAHFKAGTGAGIVPLGATVWVLPG